MTEDMYNSLTISGQLRKLDEILLSGSLSVFLTALGIILTSFPSQPYVAILYVALTIASGAFSVYFVVRLHILGGMIDKIGKNVIRKSVDDTLRRLAACLK